MTQWLQRIITRLGLDANPRLRKFVIGVIGITVVLIGLALVVLPGPAFVVLPVGLAILATEFAWARRVIRRGKLFVLKVRRRVTADADKVEANDYSRTR
ncbi:MAG: PGPGW domain-containing protein [Chthoniobacterales bacterium]